jgi:DNA-binding NarL/FixJ family response regulator
VAPPTAGLKGEIRGHPLSGRELEVLRSLGRRGYQKGVAGELGISPQTVHSHLATIYRKLGVTTAIEAYRELGWLNVDAP